jgi:DNA-binding protein HU-beta
MCKKAQNIEISNDKASKTLGIASLLSANLLIPFVVGASRALGETTMAKKAPSAKPNRPVTLKHLAHALAESHELTKKQGEALLGDLVGMITKHLKKGEKLRLTGLGMLQVRKRAARMGRNPATGEAIKIKASKKVAFRAAKELKEAV